MNRRTVLRSLALTLFAASSLACSGLIDAVTPAQIPADMEDMVGNWTGEGIVMQISPEGQLHWEDNSGTATTSLDAPIQAWGDGWFEAGVGPMKKRFTIDKKPRHKGLKKWSVTVDGHALTR